MAMGVCGVVLTAIGSLLDAIAENCHTDSTKIGSVFIARGGGAILGAILSAKLYAPPRVGNNVLKTTLMMLIALVMSLPFISSVTLLHVVFTGLGFATAVTDTGCQIMTRRTHGVQAGPWLGANTVVFGIAGAIVPVIDIITSNMVTMCAVISTVALITLALLQLLEHPEDPDMLIHLPPKSNKKIGGSLGKYDWVRKYYMTEAIIGCTTFWLIGGKVLCSSYIEDYVKQMHTIPTHEKAFALMTVWVAIAAGRFGGLYDQILLNGMGPSGLHPCYRHVTCWLAVGLAGSILWQTFPRSKIAFWLGLSLYGFGNGPCVGYLYDLNNRLTPASEIGMSIVMFGLNFGASLIPYIATLLWEHTALGPRVLPGTVMVTMALPLPLLLLSRPINDIASIPLPRPRAASAV